MNVFRGIVFQEHPILSRVESLSAAEVGDLSHEITSLAAAFSLQR
jgi:hypothetical protein